MPADVVPFMSDVTHILSAIEQGDPHAAEQLLPLVYDELRKLAAQKLAQEKPGQTLEATALVHEAYLRLVDVDQGGGLERLARLLVGELLRRQLAQLLVHQRQELLGGVRVAVLDRIQHLGDRVHGQATNSSTDSPLRRKRLCLKGGSEGVRPGVAHGTASPDGISAPARAEARSAPHT